MILAVCFGTIAAFVFCFSGAFGTVGQELWYDIALLGVTLTAAVALTYVGMLLISYAKRPANTPGNPEAFEWHLLIPCRDEEAVVAETVSEARASFPLAHVWVIDDASGDATAAIVHDLMDVDDRVHLISRVAPEARTGKGDALNAAYRIISEHVGGSPEERQRVVFGVLDADGFLSDNALSLLAGPQGFGDEQAGAVQLEVWMKNRNDRRPRPDSGRFLNALGRFLVRMQDVEFRTSNSAMQLLRVQTGTVGMGGNGQFARLSVLDRIAETKGKPWGRKLSEDYELGLNILTLGMRTHYLRDAHVSQEALPHFRRLVTQRTRWAQGIMECRDDLPALRRSRTLSVPGFLEIHYFMNQAWLMLLNLILVPLLLIHAVMNHAFGFLGDVSTTLMLVGAMVFVILPYAIWGPIYRRWAGEPISWVSSLLLGLGYLCYVYLTYLCYPRAMWRMLTGRTSWSKTRRNAEGTLAIAAATPPALIGVPLLDPSALSDLGLELGGPDEELRQVVSAYTVMWPKRIAHLRLAVASENPQATVDAIGSIRVSSAILGTPRLEQAATELAEKAAEGDYAACRADLPTISRVGEDTVAAVRGEYLSLGTRALG